MTARCEDDIRVVQEIISNRSRIRDLSIVSQEESLIVEGGKLIRPRLVVLTALMCGYAGTAHRDYAAAVELMHNATLFHDDVIDSAEMRRGHETLNMRSGNTFAILAGDFVLAQAFELIASHDDPVIFAAFCQCLRELVFGQMKEMDLECDINSSLDDYYKVIDNKTGSLIKASVLIGAKTARADSETLAILEGISEKTGRLFQIADDVIDYLGDEKKTGKKQFQDIREGKVTLPAICLMELCTPAERAEFGSKLGMPNMPDSDGNVFIEMLVRYGIIRKMHEQYRAVHDEIISDLGRLSTKPFFEDFSELIDKISGRLYAYTTPYLDS